MKIVIAVMPPGYEDKYPWKEGASLLLLGEIENMKGHVAVVDREGKVYWGYHDDSFRDATEDEI